MDLKRPKHVQKAMHERDTNRLRMYGSAGGRATARKWREQRDREDTLRELDDEIHERSMSAMALEANEDIVPLDTYN